VLSGSKPLRAASWRYVVQAGTAALASPARIAPHSAAQRRADGEQHYELPCHGSSFAGGSFPLQILPYRPDGMRDRGDFAQVRTY